VKIRIMSLGGDTGFTLVELLVASAITLTVTASVFALVNPAHGIFKVQPEVADLQQRLRVGVDVLARALVVAGAGATVGPTDGPLVNYLAPVLPYRMGLTGSDPIAGRYYRPDAITVLHVPETPSQTTIRDRIAVDAQELRVNAQVNCPQSRAGQLCGFAEKMRVLLFDASGAWDMVTITDAEDPVLRVQSGGNLAVPYEAGSSIVRITSHTYYLKTDIGNGAYQLMHYDGYQSDLPLIDNVVKLEFSYFGEPQPPTLRPGKRLDDPAGPFTTYGPRPPLIYRDNPHDSWAEGENCIFTVHDGQQVPRLQVMVVGATHVELRPDVLSDGPWCADAAHVNRFDADLLRIRRVRVTLRVQAAAASMRGPAGVLFTHGGTAKSRDYVPDHEIRFDVTPRNLNPGR
jgi:prepilin-type N-terminal cleavage/methylation domain-containing protein